MIIKSKIKNHTSPRLRVASQKLKAIGSFLGYLVVSARLSPALAALQDITIDKPEDYVKIDEISPLIQGIIRIAFIVAIILTFLFLLWGGLQWITSGGDKTKYEEARNRITAAFVGLAIILLAWLIIRLVTYFFGLPDIWGGDDQLTLPTLYGGEGD
jgi:hypothetical protein